MRRDVQPELLDHLPASAPWAARSHHDLRRLNRILGHAPILTEALSEHLDQETVRARSLRVCELGAGDGTLLLELARAWSAFGVTADAELLDLRYLMTEETRHAFVELGWNATALAVDAAAWLHQSRETADVILANLFLHHFEEDRLRDLLRRIAVRTDLFIACEPRRSFPGLAAAHLLWAVGCNPVIRHDAPISIRAGFTGTELSALWPDPLGWLLVEHPAGPFSHCFIAKRYR